MGSAGDGPAPGTAGAACITWTDTTGARWAVQLRPDGVSLRSSGGILDFPRQSWPQDVYVTAHDNGFIIRFETFDRGIVFPVSSAEAAPFLQHIAAHFGEEKPSSRAPLEETREEPLLWPRVSRLAVWALVTSALTFVPVLGIVPAAITVVLLLLHRHRVRRTRAWSHSRKLCVAATCFLIAGLISWALSTWGLTTSTREWAPGANEGTWLTPRTSVRFRPGAPVLRHAELVRIGTTADMGAATRSTSWPRDSAERAGFLSSASLGEREYNWPVIVAGMLVVLLSLTVHEAGHAVTAWWLGDDLARRLGRVTLNPLAHLDLIGTVILPLILFLANTGMLFGWARPVPVRAEVLAHPRRGHILISLAGPGANLLLAAASMTLLMIVGCAMSVLVPTARVERFGLGDITSGVGVSGFAMAPVIASLCTILKLSMFLNVFLAFFNLIPIPPLDGSWILGRLFPQTVGRAYDVVRPYGLLVFVGLMYTGILQHLLWPAAVVLAVAFVLLDSCTVF
ncbi:MAG: site-2 protease family protein [Phycisphaerae bacterium]